MKLSRPLPTYDPNQRSSDNFSLEQADRANHKRDQDIEVGTANIILTSPNGTRYAISISDAGVISTATV